MDPTAWPMWLKLIAGWGPLAAWAATAQRSANKKDLAYHATRDAHEAALKKQASDHAKELREVVDSLTNRVEAMQIQHREEVSEMADRFINLTATHVAQSHALIDRVAALTDAIRRGVA